MTERFSFSSLWRQTEVLNRHWRLCLTHQKITPLLGHLNAPIYTYIRLPLHFFKIYLFIYINLCILLAVPDLPDHLACLPFFYSSYY